MPFDLNLQYFFYHLKLPRHFFPQKQYCDRVYLNFQTKNSNFPRHVHSSQGDSLQIFFFPIKLRENSEVCEISPLEIQRKGFCFRPQVLFDPGKVCMLISTTASIFYTPLSEIIIKRNLIENEYISLKQAAFFHHKYFYKK